MVALIVFVSSLATAPLVASWLSGRNRPGWWPIAAFALQLGFHVAWTGILAGHSGLHDDVAVPLASGLGVVTIAVISLLLRLVARRPPRREGMFGVLAAEPVEGGEEVFGVLKPAPIEADKEPAPRLPRAQVVTPRKRRRHSAYRRRR